MPDKKNIVINTGPILALCAGLGELDILDYLYSNIYVPQEVVFEIHVGGKFGFALSEF
jgi:predicted nucleic acid-binding protein